MSGKVTDDHESSENERKLKRFYLFLTAAIDVVDTK